MSATQPFYTLFKDTYRKFNRIEIFILEAEIFINICKEINLFFKNEYKEYLYVMKTIPEKEESMLSHFHICLIINDILASTHYNLMGIAVYTNTPEEVITDIIIGCNTQPSAIFLQRIIDLHRTIRGELYQSIAARIIHSAP
ncbi:MAG: hypothetical protein H0W64_05155 [Gammaproteobacteria bacterium]|nr:hypothetical protein [Gammaproteobacteria bacterium]